MRMTSALQKRNWVQGATMRALLACAALVAAAVVPGMVSAVSLTMESSKTESGAVKLCVGLDSGGEKVAGTQNDLIWNGACASLKANSCAAIPDSKKPLHGNTPPNLQSTYRALVFALDNVDPIRDGALYCCEFELSGSDSCCEVRFDRLGASDPVGNAQTTTGKPEKICLAGGVPPAAAAPAAPAAAPAAPSAGGNWLWLGLIGVAVVVTAVLIMRSRSS